ncbi:hypothetical protein P4474_11320, partial [Geobacillus stearothermophilus]|uniref:hypothetical protein n=1 Tax=Geobacillus stearothermophilus TaxID=1422 RepID=UPI002E1A3089|nr:hypothetical protein [Geobacillus stearothermophilus]
HREHLLGLFVSLLTFYRKGALFSIPFGFYWIINTPVVIQIKGDEKRRQQDAEGMKKRHKQRIPQFGYKWQIWYQPICLPLACSRGDDGPLLLDPKKCSGMLANPSE